MKSDSPLISVIVPVRNGQDYLENCVCSIEEQTYTNLEVILVNDGSSDATGGICVGMKSRYDNIRILTLGGAGVSAARNAGIDAAGGEFITFVDADDRIRSDMIRILYDCLKDTQSDAAGCGFFVWSSEEEWLQGAPQQADGQSRVYDPASYLREAVLCGNSRCWSKLYRRELFDGVRFPENLTIGEDMLFLIRMLSHVTRIAEIDYKGYGYYTNPSGAMNCGFTPRYMDQITCWQMAREEVLRLDRSLDAQVTAHCMTGIMLTVGKIAVLPAEKRREYKTYVCLCHEKLKETVRVPGARKRLSAGYRLKTGVFLRCPELYVWMYHMQKAVRGSSPQLPADGEDAVRGRRAGSV